MISFSKRKACAIFLIASCLYMISSPLVVKAQIALPGHYSTGPFIDAIIYDVIREEENQVLALLNGEIEAMGEFLDPQYVEEVEEAENVEIAQALRNGYGFITINTAKYPFNITAFRRAFAFAYDKYKVSNDIFDGLSLPMDSCVPRINPLSIEEELPYHYYEEQLDVANELLDNAGFLDTDDEDDWREAPNGEPFSVQIEAHGPSAIAMGVAGEGARALNEIGINAEAVAADFYEYLSRLNNHLDYDMVFLAYGFSSMLIHNFLAYEFHSESADVQNLNMPNFRNASYDSWRHQLLYGTTWDEVAEAAAEMQKIWVYQCPMVVAYNNIYMTPYRTDTFEGYVNDVALYIADRWTHRKVHLKADQTIQEGNPHAPYGGTFTQSASEPPGSFNIYVATSGYSFDILRECYGSLYTFDNNSDFIPMYATDYDVETHSDNPEIPEGNTRFTFYLLDNATFANGEPLTADDFAFSLNFIKDGVEYGNPAGIDIQEMTAAYAKTPYELVVQFSTESYWHFYNIAFNSVLSKQAFLDAGIGPEDWQTWDPVFGDPEDHPQVESGAFKITEAVPGEFTKLEANENFVFYPERPEPIETTTTAPPPDPTMAIVAGAVGAAVVILVGGYLVMRQK